MTNVRFSSEQLREFRQAAPTLAISHYRYEKCCLLTRTARLALAVGECRDASLAARDAISMLKPHKRRLVQPGERLEGALRECEARMDDLEKEIAAVSAAHVFVDEAWEKGQALEACNNLLHVLAPGSSLYSSTGGFVRALVQDKFELFLPADILAPMAPPAPPVLLPAPKARPVAPTGRKRARSSNKP